MKRKDGLGRDKYLEYEVQMMWKFERFDFFWVPWLCNEFDTTTTTKICKQYE